MVLATLGWRMQSLWDWRKPGNPESPLAVSRMSASHSTENSEEPPVAGQRSVTAME